MRDDAVAPKSPPKQRLAKKIPATKKMPKKTKAKKNTTVLRLVVSPVKEKSSGFMLAAEHHRPASAGH